MKRSRAIASVVVLAVIAVAAFIALRPREPVYAGKKLSEWLKILGNLTGEDRTQAEAAIHQIGTNAFPTLIEMLRGKDSWLKVKFMALASEQSFVKVDLISADRRRFLAMVAIEELGPAARPALPALIELLNNADTTDYARRALGPLLSFLEPEDTLLLVKPFTNENWKVWTNVESLLGREGVATALIPRLKDQDPGVRLNTIELFVRLTGIVIVNDSAGKYSAVVDGLIEALQDTSPAVRAAAARALGGSVVDAQRAVPVLLNHANDPDEGVREAVADALSRIGPDPATHADPEAAASTSAK